MGMRGGSQLDEPCFFLSRTSNRSSRSRAATCTMIGEVMPRRFRISIGLDIGDIFDSIEALIAERGGSERDCTALEAGSYYTRICWPLLSCGMSLGKSEPGAGSG